MWPGTQRWGLGAPSDDGAGRGHWAVCHAPEPFDEQLAGERLLRGAPRGSLLRALSPVSPLLGRSPSVQAASLLVCC